MDISCVNLQELDRQIEDYCEKNSIFGVLRVALKGNTVFQKSMGLADFEAKRPFDENSMFTFYSMSKPFCVMGLLKLYDRGLVDIDRHPSAYLPEAEGLDGRVTIRQMLHHISGLPDFAQNTEFASKHKPGYARYAREHLKMLAGYPQYFAPGTDGKYENVNMILSALIIENISGLSYAEYMKKEVFQPLGMKNAVVDNEDLYIPNRVQGYECSDGKIKPVGKCHDWLLGAGDIVGTADDAYALRRAIKDGLLLKAETWREALTPSPINRMGMGCYVTDWHGKRRITHNGGHTGFRLLHIYLPDDDFDMLFMSNSGYGNARADLSEIVYSAFYGKTEDKSDSIEMDKGYIK